MLDRTPGSSKMKYLLISGFIFAAFHISHSATPEFCDLPHDEGTGATIQFSIYYDTKEHICLPFVYKGEGGNNNRFNNERECMSNCSAEVEKIYPVNPTQACHFPKAKGRCKGNYLRFYYDSINKKCKTFFWSGCIGNGNRFLDQKTCNETCDGIHDYGDTLEEDEPNTPIALICGLVFGIIGAIILIVVIVLVVKSKNKPTRAGKKAKVQKEESPLQDRAIEMS